MPSVRWAKSTVAALAVALALATGCGSEPAATRQHRKPLVPALDIQPRISTVRARETLQFTVYLVEGKSSSLIDPTQVSWSVSREDGAPGEVRGGVFTAPRTYSNSPCVVRGVYRSSQFAGLASDSASVFVIPPKGREAAGSFVQESGSFVGPSIVGQRIFDLSNPQPLERGPKQPTVFAIGQRRRIVYVMTSHWNDGRGMRPGMIGFRDSNGRTYGPWQATGRPAKDKTPNAYWVVHPNVTLPTGMYTMLDSSPETWSHNETSGGRGICIVEAAWQ